MDACVNPAPEMHAGGAFETDSPPYAKGGFLVTLIAKARSRGTRRAELVANSIVLQVGKGRCHCNVYARGIQANCAYATQALYPTQKCIILYPG